MDQSIDRIPWTTFYNKRDLSEDQIAPVDSLDLLFHIRERKVRRFIGDCISGANVFNALNEVTQEVLRDFMLKDDLEN
jgi:hypothetical protein